MSLTETHPIWPRCNLINLWISQPEEESGKKKKKKKKYNYFNAIKSAWRFIKDLTNHKTKSLCVTYNSSTLFFAIYAYAIQQLVKTSISISIFFINDYKVREITGSSATLQRNSLRHLWNLTSQWIKVKNYCSWKTRLESPNIIGAKP